MVKGAAKALDVPIRLLFGHAHDALEASNAALIASGTATLEAALFKRPMVIVYRMHPWSWWWMKSKALQPWVGLPNILCNESLVPEFLQEQVQPQALWGLPQLGLHVGNQRTNGKRNR